MRTLSNVRRWGAVLCLESALLPPAAAAPATHDGGVLRLVASAAAGTIDPHINYEEKYNQLYAFLQDGLVTFRKAGGEAGREVVPDLAEALPEIRDGGLTYVFRLRRGVRFSTGAEVGADDVAASLRRMFKVSGPNVGSWYRVIAGADACLAQPASCRLQGVTADGAARTVTIRLVQPDGEFLQQMAMSLACILPANTPGRDLGTQPAAATGPYMIASYDPTREMRIVRNPYFHQWSAAAQPAGHVDRMVYRFGLQDESEVTAVENGDQDWMFDEKPLDRLPEIGSRFADRVHLSDIAAYYYLPLNTRLPPFDSLDARRAVALAIDRRALVNLWGGPAMGRPLCHLLPDGIPGSAAYCPFTMNPGAQWTAPDLEQARALVRRSGTAGVEVTIVTTDKEVERTMGIYLQSVLSDIGYRASVRALSSNMQFPYVQNTRNRVQISLMDWYQDYPAASDFLAVMFSCGSFHPGLDSSINMAGFCDAGVQAQIDRALAAEATDMPEAVKLWTGVDRAVTDAVPAVALFQPRYLDIVSARLGGYVVSPIYRMLMSQVYVK